MNIPYYSSKYDIDDLLKAIHPRELLVLAFREDKYTQDDRQIYDAILMESQSSCSLKEFKGEHALYQEQFDLIVNWFENKSTDSK